MFINVDTISDFKNSGNVNEVTAKVNYNISKIEEFQSLVTEIKSAFESLSLNSTSLLHYLSNDIKSDYDLLLSIANNYEISAQKMNDVAISVE